MTGQDLFSLLTILIFIVISILAFKRKIDLFADAESSLEVFITIIYILSIAGVIIILGIWFEHNWKTKIL